MELERDVLVSPTQEVPMVEGKVVVAIRALADCGVGSKAPVPDPTRLRSQPSSAFLQYSTHLAISAMGSAPGTLYSNSMIASIGHLLLRIVCRTALIGVSPWPKGTLSPSLPSAF